jgi:hypothetical protein
LGGSSGLLKPACKTQQCNLRIFLFIWQTRPHEAHLQTLPMPLQSNYSCIIIDNYYVLNNNIIMEIYWRSRRKLTIQMQIWTKKICRLQFSLRLFYCRYFHSSYSQPLSTLLLYH